MCFFKVLGFEIEPVLACLGPVLGCLDVTWACLEPVLGLSGAGLGLSGESLGFSLPVWTCLEAVLALGSRWKYQKSRKPKKNMFFQVLGFKREPVLACLGPVLGCAGPVLGCLVLSWAVLELF